MVALSLKICIRQCNLVKTMQFEPSTAVYDACRIIRERVPEAQTGQGTFSRHRHTSDRGHVQIPL
jgi:talin